MNDTIKPSILPGFMELLPNEQIAFNKMKDTIRKSFEHHGFLPIDTPIIEKTEVILAKGGGETDKQVYRFKKGDKDMTLRFDLTVPLARYTVEHFSELVFPFRRYQIGKVYRGERAQKGRFREFYQCDIDIIGNESLDILNDALIPIVIYDTFKNLGFNDFTIRINNRKILSGFFKSLGIENSIDVLRIIDKAEKIETNELKELLKELYISDEDIEKILYFISINSNDSKEIFEKLKALNIQNDLFIEGIEELTAVIKYIEDFEIPTENYKIDLKIARGLDYYTGTVYETILNKYKNLGSICSGGRYDNLANNYTDRKLPGVGISIGLSRLFYQLNQENLIDFKNESLIDLLIIPMDDFEKEAIKLLIKIRKNNIKAMIYSEKGKLKKKFKYADSLNIPYALVIGENEVINDKYVLKDMTNSNQKEVSFDELIEIMKKVNN